MGGLPIGGIMGLPIGGIMGGLPIGGIMGGLPIVGMGKLGLPIGGMGKLGLPIGGMPGLLNGNMPGLPIGGDIVFGLYGAAGGSPFRRPYSSRSDLAVGPYVIRGSVKVEFGFDMFGS